ncbi:MAG TPA: apolipoprotein N-acyltransferase [Steroidobacteraceae bacterium]|nr:apolipoprotein N-acyltransferase [Steroidobacteraceae bacterium]
MRAAVAAGGAGAALKRHGPWVAFALGALQSLAFAPFALWPLGVACLAALWWLWQGVGPRRAALAGFGFGAGLFLAGTYWLYTSIHVFGQAPLALALLLMLGLVAIMGLYTAGLAWLLMRFAADRPLPMLLAAVPAGWVLLEWFRGWFLSGFPWLAVGYSHLDTPLAGFAPVVGIYGVSLAVALTAGLVLASLEVRGRTRALLLGAVAALWITGALLGRIDWTTPAGAPLTVAIVQGAIPQDQKWQAENRGHTLEVYRSLTQQALGARLIVWPEAALPILYHEAVPFLAPLYREAQARGSDLILGAVRYDFETQQVRNGLVVLGAEEEWYYKRRLVPFGEFFPVPGFVREWMRLKSLAYVDFLAGARDQGALDAAGQKLGATICYEDAYASEQLAVLADATLLVNVSNDAWFGDSTAPHQHLQIARMRALEAGRWLIRATNNGVSALIDPRGRVAARTRQFVPEVLKGAVVPRAGRTPYAYLGNWPVISVCFALLVAVAPWRQWRGAGRR